MPMRPIRVLIVEDQFLIAKQIELLLAMGGQVVAATATTFRDALDRAAESCPDIALVDLSLADGPSGFEIARHLKEKFGIAVVFVTANRRRLPSDLGGAIGIVEKPFSKTDFLSAMSYIEAMLRGKAPPRVPASLHLASQAGQAPIPAAGGPSTYHFH